MNTNGNGNHFWRNVTIMVAVSILTAMGTTIILLMVNHEAMRGVDSRQDLRLDYIEKHLNNQ